jgi:hypothetical protein
MLPLRWSRKAIILRTIFSSLGAQHKISLERLAPET